MTEPLFSGLKTAIKMPSSRIRISAFHTPVTNGFFVHSLKVENDYFHEQQLRFNRQLNCITGKKGAGKSDICELMQAAVNPGFYKTNTNITLIIEKIIDSVSHYYAFYRDCKNNISGLYEIDPDRELVFEIDLNQAKHMSVPKFYNAAKIEKLIMSPKEMNSFLIKHFGQVSIENICDFNEIFSISGFFEQEKEQLLFLWEEDGKYRLSINTQWRMGKEKMKDFFSLSHSMRKTAMMCMVIIMSEFGPAIINAPEADFDNDDIMNFLVPIIKKYKDKQQVILFTNNPILAVNTDPDNYILLNTKGTKFKNITSGFAIDDLKNREKLLNVVEGGIKSIKKRISIYT